VWNNDFNMYYGHIRHIPTFLMKKLDGSVPYSKALSGANVESIQSTDVVMMSIWSGFINREIGGNADLKIGEILIC